MKLFVVGLFDISMNGPPGFNDRYTRYPEMVTPLIEAHCISTVPVDELIIHIRVTGIILIVRAVSLPGARLMIDLPFQLFGTLNPVSGIVLVTIKTLDSPAGTSMVYSVLPDGIEADIALMPAPVTDKLSEPRSDVHVVPANAFVMNILSISSNQFTLLQVVI